MSEETPQSVLVGDLVKANIDEIKGLIYVIENPSAAMASKKVFPKHLRRRAMSHDVRRIPSRLREYYLSLREKCNTREGKVKVPRKKYRRRPKNLAKDYIRRQKKVAWLETHIWHAKRFQMITRWNYKIPYTPCDKSYRACFRATSEHCLVQDISFYNCIEITNKLENIMKWLDSHTNKAVNTSMNIFLNGDREGSLVLYKCESYPLGLITEARFIWKPDGVEKTLWLWLHPDSCKEVLSELETSDLSFSLIKDLARFQLSGPLSQAVLAKALLTADLSNRNDWAANFNNSKQNEYWDNVKYFNSPAQLPPGLIIPLTVYDTRITLQCKKKATNNKEPVNWDIERMEPKYLTSPLWDKEIRKKVSSLKLTVKQINDARSKKLVPGQDLEEDINWSKIPVFPILLLQRPGSQSSNKKLGFGSGWDIICEKSYSMALWISLIFNGARAGGLKEADCNERECSKTGSFQPGSSGYAREAEYQKKNAFEKWWRKPPAKRHNYIKLGMPTPFHCPWDILVNDWSGTKNYYTLRDRRVLLSLKNFKVPEKDAPGALVAVSIKLIKKGTLTPYAHICLPEKNDFQQCPIEESHTDENQQERELTRDTHITTLKRLAKHRKLGKEGNSSDVIETYDNKIKELWLPECKNIRNLCSREILGFVSNGDFCFTEGVGAGLGYVSFQGIINLIKLRTNGKVLIRTNNTLQYRIATLNVLTY